MTNDLWLNMLHLGKTANVFLLGFCQCSPRLTSQVHTLIFLIFYLHVARLTLRTC